MKTLTQLATLTLLGVVGFVGHQVIIKATDDALLSAILHTVLFFALISNLHILNKKLEK